jgi:GT2 family glycosyltransferase
MQAAIVDFQLGDEPVVLGPAPLGANSAYRRETFERFGLFRTDLGHVGRRPLPCEDTEFARRVQRQGGELRYAPGATVYHDVDPARLTRRYFLEWYEARGRAEMMEALPAGTAIWYADVPRYLIRSVLFSVARWAFSIDRTRRFFYKLQTYQTAGAIAQARALRRAGRRG